MNNVDSRGTRRADALFFFSVLLYLLAEFLYAWGPPAWFGRFPYATGLRFLLALESYFLCCAAFFRGRIAASRTNKPFTFPRAFSLSFAAIPVFALLVACGASVQVLRGFACVLGIAVWLVASIAAVVAIAARGEHARESPTRGQLAFPALFLVTGILLAIPAVPALPTIALRFLFLALLYVARAGEAHDARGERDARSSSDGNLRREPADACGLTDAREVAERFSLSPRETDVLALLIAGKTNGEIAETLFISLSTVKTHIASIFGKTGARNRLEASALCRK
jgi:DNA-binding CsgD family transcriptional regulator